ncbi:prenylcysteine oxidase 1-like isoform X2 [Belonocnema kinseyi]|uniref:prenylcysteine oxidase 1-like isoform X2 n=1 Tax=Belonocnema kinseyi TaxID=2817044 RepID=UPI00143D3981|nr:prenylcysteine oxidase 1-like isoform X2 [Belonocnema kinseyi]
MHNCIKLLILVISICKRSFSTEICKPKVAIIGGGIGGASASHYLTDLFKNNLKIDLFEPIKLGGRLATIEIGENEYEAGGSVIHPRNKYMQYFVKLLGLEKKDPGGSSISGIWNGEKFVFTESKWEIVTLTKMIYRYGFQPIKLNRYVNWILDNFDKIYDFHESGVAFENVSSLLYALNHDFPGLLNISLKDHLHNLEFSTLSIDELAEATLVVNYNQETNVHSFVGLVSIAGAGSDLWSIKGGNKKVPENLIRRNNLVKVIPSGVEKIRLVLKNENSLQYELFYRNKGNPDFVSDFYDIVIIATPLTVDQEYPIKFEEFPPETLFHFPGKYQTTVATFVHANLNTFHFGLEDEIDAVYSCNPNFTNISSVGKVDSVSEPKKGTLKTWKVFTKENMTPAFMNKIFSQVGDFKVKSWKAAYPRYSTENRFDRFKLQEGLYHVNAIEWAASAMEMSAIGGRNVAILAYKDFTKKCSSYETERKTEKAHSSELKSTSKL